ncbi:hypothetical protein C9374_011919 [Naegleria lovaniensis]|uniref:Methyltransferase domain-containing protein n=1 Tax=Naegleria lovaniensis TaxID=51637 RepID=A0AA88GDW4_NAELO|nr:uncharacterized protein C9374_011919 [Naegleria lovaniensis]KAG2373630.1 hypothetical protein C9374_011919 [Naegleria lovaniensis]
MWKSSLRNGLCLKNYDHHRASISLLVNNYKLFNHINRRSLRRNLKGSEQQFNLNQLLTKAIEDGILEENHFKNTTVIDTKNCAPHRNNEIQNFRKLDSLQYVMNFDDLKETPSDGYKLFENCTFTLLFSEPNTQVWKMTNIDYELLAYFTLKKSDYTHSHDKKAIITLFDESSKHWDTIISISGYQSVVNWVQKTVKDWSLQMKNSSFPLQNLNVLDAACGGGYTAQPIFTTLNHENGLKTNIMGIDISSGMLQVALQRAPQIFQMGMSTHDLDEPMKLFPNECFDIISCVGVVEFLQNFESVTLPEFKRLLRKDQHAEIWFTAQFQPDPAVTSIEKDKEGHHLYNQTILETLLAKHDLYIAENGLEIIQKAYKTGEGKRKNTATDTVSFIAVRVKHKL